jgi:hypothetical protein
MQARLADVAQAYDLAYDSVAKAHPRHFCEATSAMKDSTLPFRGLSPVGRKSVVAKFDGGLLSPDGGVLVVREVEQRLRVADRLATEPRRVCRRLQLPNRMEP